MTSYHANTVAIWCTGCNADIRAITESTNLYSIPLMKQEKYLKNSFFHLILNFSYAVLATDTDYLYYSGRSDLKFTNV